jgi:hypothetical protein
MDFIPNAIGLQWVVFNPYNDPPRKLCAAVSSQRHLPSSEIPRTLSGKKQELPIKKLLLGQPIEKVDNKDAMANPGCLDWYVAFAAGRKAQNTSI